MGECKKLTNKMKPLISIIHPSRSRPEMAAKTAKKWLSSAKDVENIRYVFSLDFDDPKLKDYPSEDWRPGKELFVIKGFNKNAIQAINHAAEAIYKAQEGAISIFIVVSDDFDCPFHWDVALLSMLEGKEDYCVKTNDGLQPWLITLPIMDRKYYERFGYIYNPAFSHMYADTELTCVAWMLDKYLKLDITFPHHHYSTGRNPKDAVSHKADSTYNSGRQVFMANKGNNFGLEGELKPLPQMQW